MYVPCASGPSGNTKSTRSSPPSPMHAVVRLVSGSRHSATNPPFGNANDGVKNRGGFATTTGQLPLASRSKITSPAPPFARTAPFVVIHMHLMRSLQPLGGHAS
jgi:hypothetical protein